MLSTRASDGNRDERLQFCQIAAEHGGEKVSVSEGKIARPRLREHIVGDRLVLAREVTQFVHPVRVLEKAHVNDMIGVEGQAVLEAKGFDGHLQGTLLPRHDVTDAPRQIVNAHRGGVDDLVGRATKGREQAHLGLDAVHEGTCALEGMRAAVGLVASHQRFGTGLEEDDAVDDARALELFESRIERTEEGTRAHIHTNGEAVHARCRIVRHHADEGGQHGRRQVVDDVPVEVFERAGSAGAARPGVAGDDEHLIGGARLVLDAHHVTHGDALGDRGRVLLVDCRGLGLGRVAVVRGCVVGHGVLLTGRLIG